MQADTVPLLPAFWCRPSHTHELLGATLRENSWKPHVKKKNISDGYKMLQTKNIEEHCFLLSCPTESHASVPRCPVPSDRPSDQWPHWCFQFSQGPLHGKLATPGPVWILQVGGQGSHRNTGWWHAMHVYYIYILLYYYYIYICVCMYV
jgi:hypothetical protein